MSHRNPIRVLGGKPSPPTPQKALEPPKSVATGTEVKTPGTTRRKPRTAVASRLEAVCTKLSPEDIAKLDRIRRTLELIPNRSATLRWLVQRYQES